MASSANAFSTGSIRGSRESSFPVVRGKTSAVRIQLCQFISLIRSWVPPSPRRVEQMILRLKSIDGIAPQVPWPRLWTCATLCLALTSPGGWRQGLAPARCSKARHVREETKPRGVNNTLPDVGQCWKVRLGPYVGLITAELPY